MILPSLRIEPQFYDCQVHCPVITETALPQVLVGKKLITGTGRCVLPNVLCRLGEGSRSSRNAGDSLPDERASYFRKIKQLKTGLNQNLVTFRVGWAMNQKRASGGKGAKPTVGVTNFNLRKSQVRKIV